MTTEHLVLKGVLLGHSDWVTQIATSTERSDIVLSSSRDKSVIVWQLNNQHDLAGHNAICGTPSKSLHGHSNFVSDTVISSDGLYAVSSSWDGSLRLWDLSTGTSLRQFIGHKKDVLSVAFSPDNRQIVSGSRDKTIKLWNTVGDCKYTIIDDNHTEWVSCVRFSPNQRDPLMISAGWDKLVKVWNLTNCKLRTNFYGHNCYLNTVTISPDGSLCASGGRDGQIMLWDLSDGKHLCTLDSVETINALSFSPNRYWLCAASGSSIKIWNLETKRLADEFQADKECTSLAWSGDGQTLFAGFTDSQIRVFEVRPV